MIGLSVIVRSVPDTGRLGTGDWTPTPSKALALDPSPSKLEPEPSDDWAASDASPPYPAPEKVVSAESPPEQAKPRPTVSSDGPCFDQPNIVQLSSDELSSETRDILLQTLGDGLSMRGGNFYVNTNRSYIVSAEIQGPGYEGDMDIVTWVVRTTARADPQPSEVEVLKVKAVDSFGWELTRSCVEQALQQLP
jgi:hypothetical protein